MKEKCNIAFKEEKTTDYNDFVPASSSFDLTKYNNTYDSQRLLIIKLSVPDRIGKALDIGSGPGYMTKYLVENGWIVTAIDSSEKNINHVKRYTDFLYKGDALKELQKLIHNGDKYDLILSLEIIEHLPKKYGKDFLCMINSLLNNRGMLIISTPNKYSLESFGGYYLKEKLLKIKKWTAWDETHKYIYNSFEIRNLLITSGYKIKKITGYYYEGEIPKLGILKMPFIQCSLPLINMFGFNTIIKCVKDC